MPGTSREVQGCCSIAMSKFEGLKEVGAELSLNLFCVFAEALSGSRRVKDEVVQGSSAVGRGKRDARRNGARASEKVVFEIVS